MMLTKIISGGQTGADRGGLEAAQALGLATGGWMPKNWLAEDGNRPDIGQRYGLIEHSDGSYRGRTLTNTIASDGTLWFGDPRSPGGKLTLRSAQNARKAVYTYIWPDNPPVVDHFFLDWLVHNKIVVLNVAGNRESKNLGIAAAVVQYLVTNITWLRQQEAAL